MTAGAPDRSVKDDLAARLMRGGVWSLLVKVAGAALSLTMFAAVARALGEADFGRFGFAFSIGMTGAMIASLGLHSGVLRWRPMYEAAGDPAHADAAERWGLNMTLAAGIAAGAGLGLAALAIGAAGVNAFAFEGRLSPALLGAAGGFMTAMVVSEYVAGALRARGESVRALAPRDVIWRAVVTALAAGLTLGGVGVSAHGMLWAAAAALAALTAAQCLLTGLRPGRPPAGAPALGAGGEAAGWLRQATPMWGTAVLNVFGRQFEVVLIGLFLSAADTGGYFAALALAQALMLVLVAANMVAAPMIARLHHGGDARRLQKMLRVVMAGVGPTALLGFVIVALGAELLLSIFDPAFVDEAPILILLAAGSTFNALCGPSDPALNMTGHERVLLRIKGGVIVAVVLAQLALIQVWGLWGAAIPNVLGAVAWNVLAVRHSKKALGLDPTVLNLVQPLLWRLRK